MRFLLCDFFKSNTKLEFFFGFNTKTGLFLFGNYKKTTNLATQLN